MLNSSRFSTISKNRMSQILCATSASALPSILCAAKIGPYLLSIKINNCYIDVRYCPSPTRTNHCWTCSTLQISTCDVPSSNFLLVELLVVVLFWSLSASLLIKMDPFSASFGLSVLPILLGALNSQRHPCRFCRTLGFSS